MSQAPRTARIQLLLLASVLTVRRLWASDAVKRRILPAWIREGLEKMDREKQKRLEKERMEKQRAEMAKEQKKEEDAGDEEGDGPRLPRKSKFVSGARQGAEP